ncbi:D-Ala-D-Ala carboxypeptidase family metallohydrolase [Candidatus Pacearchaeota archaeon]|jgi:hypothetical protein|nr:D-Ala-D-Ala carboxypeptidase family metallohydrolase [Candidatus Pacearchaeota archaeon]
MSNDLLDAKRWPHIYLYEVACRCRYSDCPYKTLEQVLAVIDPDILDVVEYLRAHFGGRPLLITSGVRCQRHNRAEGGAEASPHVPTLLAQIGNDRRSYAVDISIVGYFASPRGMRNEIRKIYPNIRIGWMQYSKWVHLDFAFRHPYKNHPDMVKHWIVAGEW